MARGTPAVSVFAPASVANLGPGFDVLGLALRSPGDTVVARAVPGRGIGISAITGDGGMLSLDPARNTAGIAARAALKRAGVDAGITLEIHKGMPLGSGLGSSAASAAAAAFAVNVLVGSPLRKMDLLSACLEAEAAVSGRHADNVAASLLGGLILVRALDPLDVLRLPVPEGLTIAVATPAMELATRDARAVLPATVPRDAAVRNSANLAAFVAACHSGDSSLLARCIGDELATPARAPLIPGCHAVMDAALQAGALGAGISGAGPSMFALCRSERSAVAAGDAMRDAFGCVGLTATVVVSPADCPGARRV